MVVANHVTDLDQSAPSIPFTAALDHCSVYSSNSNRSSLSLSIWGVVRRHYIVITIDMSFKCFNGIKCLISRSFKTYFPMGTIANRTHANMIVVHMC